MNATRTRPTITWTLTGYSLGRDLIITVRQGQYRWQLDEPNARPSAAYADYPQCLAAARHALGLPPIGASWPAPRVRPQPVPIAP